MSRFSHHIRHNVVGYVALFFALTMGTAYATHPGGEGTISTEDLQDLAVTTPKIAAQAVGTGKLADDAVTHAKIRSGAVRNTQLNNGVVGPSKVADDAIRARHILDGAVDSAKVADGSLTADDLAGVGLLRGATVNLSVPSDAGGISQTLLRVGRVELTALCTHSLGSLIGAIEAEASGAGPVVVTDGDDGEADGAVRLGPPTFRSDVVFVEDFQFAAQESSFAIIDSDGVSASGVAAVVLDPPDDCSMTIHAIG